MPNTAIVLTNELTGLNLYFQVVDGSGQVWNGAAFEAYAAGNWANYDVAFTEQGASGRYIGTFPAAIAAGSYAWSAFIRAGVSPVESDSPVASNNVDWDGSDFVDITGLVAAVATLQADMDLIAGVDGVKLATLQPAYAPAKILDQMNLADNAITAGKYDETTAFPVVSVDTGATKISRAGGTGLDTLDSLSAQMDAAQTILAAIFSVDGVLLATTQTLYAPAKDGALMGLANNAITAAKFDETTAFPLKSADLGATQVARTGADADTLETLSDQMDAAQTILIAIFSVDGVLLATTQTLYVPAKAGDLMGLAAAAITSAKFDAATAFPLALVDAGATKVGRAGGTGLDTLDSISAQMDTAQTDLDTLTGANGVVLATVQPNLNPAVAGDVMNLAVDALDAAALATDAVAEIVAGVMAGVVDGAVTLDDAIKRVLAIVGGKVITTGTSPTILEFYADDDITKVQTTTTQNDGSGRTKSVP